MKNALALLVLATSLFAERAAEAQYKNEQFGFEAGYFYFGRDSELTQHNFLAGLRGGFKFSDHWWYTGRAGLSFPGDVPPPQNTVVLLHIVPVDVRYYFLTDAVRPFVGITNAFTILFNQQVSWSAGWGPGVDTGIEFKLRRDLYLGFEVDAFYMLIFEHDNAPNVSLTSQLIFFL